MERPPPCYTERCLTGLIMQDGVTRQHAAHINYRVRESTARVEKGWRDVWAIPRDYRELLCEHS